MVGLPLLVNGPLWCAASAQRRAHSSSPGARAPRGTSQQLAVVTDTMPLANLPTGRLREHRELRCPGRDARRESPLPHRACRLLDLRDSRRGVGAGQRAVGDSDGCDLPLSVDGIVSPAVAGQVLVSGT